MFELEQDAKFLRRLRFIRNTWLSNGAYHIKNCEIQVKNLESANAPQEEIDMITKSSDECSKLAKKLMNDYQKIMNELKNIYEN